MRRQSSVQQLDIDRVNRGCDPKGIALIVLSRTMLLQEMQQFLKLSRSFECDLHNAPSMLAIHKVAPTKVSLPYRRPSLVEIKRVDVASRRLQPSERYLETELLMG